MRRYLARMVIVVTLVTPLLVVLTYQWAPQRARGGPDQSIQVALASTGSAGGGVVQADALRPATLRGADGAGASAQLTSVALFDRSEPARPLAWYRVAAAEEGVSPYLLEALHQIESNAAPDGCWPNLEGSGAIGPFQLQRSTFESHAVDGNGDGVLDICGFADSLFSAASYLKSLGADGDLDGPSVRAALSQFGADPDRALELARYYRSRDLSVTAESPAAH
jgi:hypothetical protein